MRATLVLSSLALLNLLAGACIIHQDHPYPESWPPVSSAGVEGCRDLSGRYTDLGETYTFPAINPSLTFNLGWQGWSNSEDRDGWRDAKQVTLSIRNAESLEVLVWGANNDRITDRVLARDSGEFVCESGTATIRWHSYGAEDVVVARDDYTVELIRAGKYLVAHVHDQAVGTIGLIFPICGKTSGWVRFQRLSQ